MKKPDSITENDDKLLRQKYQNIDPIYNEIKKGYPVQYLIGNVSFYGYTINVTKDVLIPRFETETLLEKTINYINKYNLTKSSVLELGSGSGCISITLKHEIPSLEITSLDISRKAIILAKKNARLNKTNINFICKDMYKYDLLNTYDVLISNPPYINKKDKIDPKTKYEPQNAIYADFNGLEFYYQIFNIADKCLNKKHLIALEIGEEQGAQLKALAKEHFPKDKIKVEKDLAGKDRYLFVSE